MGARVDAGGGTGCATRRRERRLRSHLRHERMAVAMALAESTHHSAQRQKTARAGGEARDALRGQVPEAPLPQGWVLRHVVGHLSVPALDVLVPQMVDQLPDIEQVVEVPKILPFDVPMRAALRVMLELFSSSISVDQDLSVIVAEIDNDDDVKQRLVPIVFHASVTQQRSSGWKTRISCSHVHERTNSCPPLQTRVREKGSHTN